MQFRGVVENVVYYNDANGYSVVELDVDGTLLPAVGNLPPLFGGELLVIEGELIQNKRYGEQIKINKAKLCEPTDNESIIKYLSGGLFKGLGAVTAGRIVSAYGPDTLEVMQNNPAAIAGIKGLSMKKALDFSGQIAAARADRDNLIFLQQYNISLNLALKINKAYRGGTRAVLEENPYRLAEDIDGVGFFTADNIAREMGVEKDSEFRINAAVSYILRECITRSGHTYYPKNLLFEELYKLLNIDECDEKIEKCMLEQEIRGNIVPIEKDGFTAVMAAKFYIAEQVIASKLCALLTKVKPIKTDVAADIKAYEELNKITLHVSQKAAVTNSLVGGVCVITGGPGTGKTTIVKCITSIMSGMGLNVQLCAPTGRASKRLSIASGRDAKTIHRLLDLDFKNGKGHFTYNENTEIDCDAVIVDEVSMCDEYVFNSLIKAIRNGTRLILVGDKDQLPSVGAGNVLADIISSGVLPISKLTHIYRQGKDSSIVANAHRINNGEMPVIDNTSDFFFDRKNDADELKATVIDMVSVRLPKFASCPPSDVQVLCPLKKGAAGSNNLNIELQNKINPYSPSVPQLNKGNLTLRAGDKVIHTVNNYKMEWIQDGETGQGVFNGDIGFVTEICVTDGTLVVEYEDGKKAKYSGEEIEQLQLAYAISIHKSQGSEFNVVVVPLASGSPYILTRNLLYTAVTRAKQTVVLLGSAKVLAMMVKNDYTAQRYTLLKDFIISEACKTGLLSNEKAI